MTALQTTFKTFIFNEVSLVFGDEFSQPRENDFPSTQFKYAAFDFAYARTTDYVRTVLDAAPIQKNHKYIVVDIKVTEIKKGKPPCLPGWHCDTIINPFDETKPENHHLFVSGNASRTEFIKGPLQLNVPEDLKHQVLLKNFRDQIDEIQPSTTQIPSCRIASYGRFDFHRGSIGLYDEKRLLIRITETDVIVPRNRPFKL